MDCFDNNFQIGKSHIYITGEIGINHNGDLSIAKKLIENCKNAGADAVKFQKRTIDIVYSEEMLNQFRESPWGTTQREQKEGLEFSLEEYQQIDTYCKELNIDWYASAWDIPSQDFLNNFDMPVNKVASAMTTNVEFIERVASEKKPTFISTGMCNYEEIQTAVDIFNKQNCKFVLMHTNSEYPSRENKLNLNMISTLTNKYSCRVGYSGHEPSVSPSLIAATLGAVSIERHITLDRSMYGSDQAASLEFVGLKNLVDTIRKLNVVMGDGNKEITEIEQEVAKKLRYWE
jgi:N-acetylneuraminate synthase|tara:strand:- start:1315 stop:2181 length:867 start_codon:yes stop_codon:yes gene_type:complete